MEKRFAAQAPSADLAGMGQSPKTVKKAATQYVYIVINDVYNSRLRPDQKMKYVIKNVKIILKNEKKM